MRIATIALQILLALFVSSASAQNEEAWQKSATADQLELVSIVQAYQRQQSELLQRLREIKEPLEQLKAMRSDVTTAETASVLIAFEAKRPGTDCGLLALRQVVMLTTQSNVEEAKSARKEAFRRLIDYANHPLVTSAISSIEAGGIDPEAIACLRGLMIQPQATPELKDFSQLQLSIRLTEPKFEAYFHRRRIAELDSGAQPKFVGEKQLHTERLAELPADELLQQYEAQGIELLKRLAQSESNVYLPRFRRIDDMGTLLEVEARETASDSLAEQAKRQLFQLAHLRPTKSAPELEVELIDGKSWSLAEQIEAGRVVIVHFSLKGCRPCEAMYPTFRKLHTQYGDRLAILAVMNDSDRNKTVDAVESGKITWSVMWDGRPGKVARQWGVTHFPTAWVIDRNGTIVDYNIGTVPLEEKIATLIDASTERSR
ncbi:TlpA family protein disulfide reductase [Blastopirellula marina]|uniref:Thioredoxin domain-containing protein n=1 Tax=Blastopirellula marina TaxID=124 RepID=A0A2S8G8V4_9BACT|nr:TlpA disulfide reductase family protein [Blastopirellula marina]PQO40878.1 hypothetical protein C5Y98_04680 [Blastopirellula marina]PTL45760.1 TlpA family protein disulfide reductase [Blastopirellula marina]